MVQENVCSTQSGDERDNAAPFANPEGIRRGSKAAAISTGATKHEREQRWSAGFTSGSGADRTRSIQNLARTPKPDPLVRKVRSGNRLRLFPARPAVRTKVWPGLPSLCSRAHLSPQWILRRRLERNRRFRDGLRLVRRPFGQRADRRFRSIARTLLRRLLRDRRVCTGAGRSKVAAFEDECSGLRF